MRYTDNDLQNMKFYQLPKILFIDQKYKGVSNDAKVAYALLKDRLSLSASSHKDGWGDNFRNEKGEIYLIFTISNLCEILGLSKNTVLKVKAELANVGLLEEEKQGLGKPNRIFLNKFEVESDEICSKNEENINEVVQNSNHVDQKLDSNYTDLQKQTKKENELNKTHVRDTPIFKILDVFQIFSEKDVEQIIKELGTSDPDGDLVIEQMKAMLFTNQVIKSPVSYFVNGLRTRSTSRKLRCQQLQNQQKLARKIAQIDLSYNFMKQH